MIACSTRRISALLILLEMSSIRWRGIYQWPCQVRAIPLVGRTAHTVSGGADKKSRSAPVSACCTWSIYPTLIN
jgi:hypothetical protein